MKKKNYYGQLHMRRKKDESSHREEMPSRSIFNNLTQWTKPE